MDFDGLRLLQPVTSCEGKYGDGEAYHYHAVASASVTALRGRWQGCNGPAVAGDEGLWFGGLGGSHDADTVLVGLAPRTADCWNRAGGCTGRSRRICFATWLGSRRVRGAGGGSTDGNVGADVTIPTCSVCSAPFPVYLHSDVGLHTGVVYGCNFLTSAIPRLHRKWIGRINARIVFSPLCLVQSSWSEGDFWRCRFPSPSARCYLEGSPVQ